MPAFNKRLEPNWILGVSAVGAIGALGCLVAGLLVALMPLLVLKAIFAVLFLVSLAAAVAGFVLGDDLPFLKTMLVAWSEARAWPIESSESD